MSSSFLQADRSAQDLAGLRDRRQGRDNRPKHEEESSKHQQTRRRSARKVNTRSSVTLGTNTKAPVIDNGSSREEIKCTFQTESDFGIAYEKSRVDGTLSWVVTTVEAGKQGEKLGIRVSRKCIVSQFNKHRFFSTIV